MKATQNLCSLVFSLTISLSTLFAQCTNADNYGLFPDETFTNNVCDGSFEIIDGSCFAGEFSSVMVSIGNTYVFESSVTTDYLTIVWVSQEEVLVHGVGPLTYTATFSGEVYFYTHTDASCGESDAPRQRRISCALPAPCLNADNYGQFPDETFYPLLCDGSVDYQISGSCYAGEYSVVNVTAGNIYTFSGTIATDFLTIGNADGTVAYASGIDSVVYLATATEDVRFYTHIGVDCGESEAVRGRYVRCRQPEGCTEGIQWPTETYAPEICDGTTANLINEDAFAGEFAGVYCLVNRTYTLSSSVPTDYITITTEDGQTVLENGTTPLTFDPAASGTYRFYIHKDALCTEEGVNRSRYIICSGALGTEEIQQTHWELYPNPATTAVTIVSDEPISSIEVVSVDGKQLIWLSPTQLSTTLSVEQLKSGTYFIRTTIGGIVETRELMKH